MTQIIPTKTIVVLGAAYAGRKAAQTLSYFLPEDWRLVVIDRNSHFNHVYVFPRYTVLPKHAPKAFVPYTHMFETRAGEIVAPLFQNHTPPTTPTESVPAIEPSFAKQRAFIRGTIRSIQPRSVKFARFHDDGKLGEEEIMGFDYCIYALGASLPGPVDVWGAGGDGTKERGVEFMRERGEGFEKAKSMIGVGGGALGIQLATDFKALYPEKEVTLIHSRDRLMPIYPQAMHDGIVESLQSSKIRLILGDRVLRFPCSPDIYDGTPKQLQTTSGLTLSADLILPCTGQLPHSSLIAALSPSLINSKTSRIRIKSTLQLDQEGLEHIFAMGDCAETGAIQAGHTAWHQGDLAARNLLKMIAGVGLDEYVPSHPAIKVSLGLDKGIISNKEGTSIAEGGPEDLHAPVVWESHGVFTETYLE